MKYFAIHKYYIHSTAKHIYFSRKLKTIEIEKLARRHDTDFSDIFYEKIKVKVLDDKGFKD